MAAKHQCHLPHIRRGQSLNHACSFAKARSEDSVGVLKHAVLETDDNELRTLEPCLNETTNVLRMREIQSSVNLVENIHWRGFEL